MKFLADMGVSLSAVQALRAAEHDALHLSEQGLQRLSDSEILEKAQQEGRVILTFDLDFGDLLAASQQALPSTIIFRLQNATPGLVIQKLLIVLAECRESLAEGAIVLVEDSRYRLRRLPVK